MALFGLPRIPPRLVSRSRLIDELGEGAALVVVRGPAGSGKSVLLAEWAATNDERLRGVWLTLDETTADPSAFWAALLHALSAAELLDAGARDDTLRRIDRDETRAALAAALSPVGPLTLVIDSFELLEAPEVADDLIWIVRNCPEVHLAVATRTVTAFESAATRVALDPVVILAEELAMTPEETERLVVDSGIERRRAPELHVATAGLPLAVRIGILAVQSDPQRLAAVRGEEFTARLGEWVRELIAADRRQPRLYAFAARTAFAPILTVELAEELSGCADAVELLSVAEREGLGMWSTSRHGRIFSYTPLVQAAFISEVAARFPAERAQLWRIAARWCAQHGEGYTATRLALEIEDFDLASKFLRDVWPTDAAPTPAYMRRLKAVPRHRLRKHPFLLMVLALSYNASPAHRLRALETFGLAALAMRTARDSASLPDRVVLLAAEVAAHRVSGRVQRAITVAEKLTALLDGAGADQTDDLGDGYVLARVHAGITFLHTGDTTRALRSFEQAHAQGEGRASRTAFHALALIAGTHALLGNMRQAADAVAAIESGGWEERWSSDYVGSFYILAKTFLALDRGDYAAAQAALDVVAPHVPTIEHWPLFVYLQSTIELARGHAAEHLVMIDTELTNRPRPPVGSYLQDWLDLARAQLLLAGGRVAEVEKLIARRRPEGSMLVVARALCDLLRGHDHAAAVLCGRTLADDTVAPRTRAHLLCIAAVAGIRLGRAESALSLLAMASALMRENRLDSTFLLLPREDRESLIALERDRDVPDSPLLVDVQHMPDVMPRAAAAATELSERERVVLQKLVHTESAAQIAAELYVSPNTVKSQLRSAYRKLGVNSRDAALLAAVERGLLEK